MSETPETDADAFVRKAGQTYTQFQDGEYVRACTSRRIERERDKAITQAAELASMLERTVDMLHECSLRDQAYALLNRIDRERS